MSNPVNLLQTANNDCNLSQSPALSAHTISTIHDQECSGTPLNTSWSWFLDKYILIFAVHPANSCCSDCTYVYFGFLYRRLLGLFAEFRRPSTRPIWKRFTPSPRLRRSGQCTTIFLPLQRFRWGTATIWWGKKDAHCGKNLTIVMGALGRSNASNLIP